MRWSRKSSLSSLREFKGVLTDSIQTSFEAKRKRLGEMAVSFLEGDDSAENPFLRLLQSAAEGTAGSSFDALGFVHDSGKGAAEAASGAAGATSASSSEREEEDIDEQLLQSYVREVHEYEPEEEGEDEEEEVERKDDKKTAKREAAHGGPPAKESGEAPKAAPPAADSRQRFFSNSALHIVRLVGRYVQMLATMDPIRGDVFEGVAQVLGFYACTVFSIFGSPPVAGTPSLLGSSGTPAAGSGSAASALSAGFYLPESDRQLPEELLSFIADVYNALSAVLPGPTVRVRSIVPLEVTGNMFGTFSRVVGVEGLRSVVELIGSIKSRILTLVPKLIHSRVNGFFQAADKAADAIRLVTYQRFVPFADLLLL